MGSRLQSMIIFDDFTLQNLKIFILQLIFQGSPGNLSQFEDLLFGNVEQIEANIVIALKLRPDFRNNKV